MKSASISLFASTLLLLGTPAWAQSLALEGTYQLVSATRTVVATGDVEDSFGPNPVGFIMYSSDGRMMVQIVHRDRPSRGFRDMTDSDRVQLFETMAAYSGTYCFDGKIVRHHIDVSWNNVLTGTVQSRHVRREGDLLFYTSGPAPSPTNGEMITGELVWRRVSDATGPKR